MDIRVGQRSGGNPRIERFPETLASIVEVETKDRRKFKHEVIYPKGNVKNPMTREDVEKKFRALGAVSITGDRCEGILKGLLQLGQSESITGLCDLLRS